MPLQLTDCQRAPMTLEVAGGCMGCEVDSGDFAAVEGREGCFVGGCARG